MEVMAVPKRSLNGTVLRRSTLCEEVNGLGVSTVEEEFKGTGAGVSYVFDQATQLCAGQYETYNDRNSNTPRCPK